MASPLALALMQGQQQSTPQQPFRATVQPTDVEKAYSDYQNSMMQAYQAQLQQQNAMWGGLAGLGGAGLLALSGGGGLASLLGGGVGGSGLSQGAVSAIGGMDAASVPDSLSNAYGKALGLSP